MLIHGRFLTQWGRVVEGEIELKNGRIVRVEPGGKGVGADLDTDGIVVPGFVELQINAGFGHDLTFEPESVTMLAEKLPSTGVTAFLATLITSPLEEYPQKLRTLAGAALEAKGAVVLGTHLEGPYLNPASKGAHDPLLMREPNMDELPMLLGDGFTRLMTLAPELPGAHELIAELCRRGIVVSMGHSAATYEQAVEAMNRGVSYGTHLFNAMPAFHHRKPGLIGALLTHPIPIGMIVDGLHLHPETVRLVYQVKGSAGITLVTDAMAALGMPPGRYVLGNQEVTVRPDGSARLADGTLAGSTLSMNRAVWNMVRFSGCTLAQAVEMASLTPAKVLGLESRKGRIAPGYDADLTVLGSSGEVLATVVAGEMVYKRG